MSLSVRLWKCQRTIKGVKCGYLNPARNKKCLSCGKARPARKQPAHMAVLGTLSYEELVEIFGDRCGICGKLPQPGRRLDRDHEHKGVGRFRGILCNRCNRLLNKRMDELPTMTAVEFLRAAADYLDRADELMPWPQ